MQQSLFSMTLTQEEPVSSKTVQNQLQTSLSETVFTVIDLETTGLSAKKNAITEITAIQYKNGQEQAKFSTLVKPTEAISDEVLAITGISNEMVQNAPALLSVLTDLCAFVGASPLVVGHNVSFDINFLREKLQQNNLGSLSERFTLNKAFCTKALAVKAIPGLPSYEGMVVATQCGVLNPNPHRAENDVRMSAGILFAIIDRLKAQGQKLETVQDLFDYQGTL